MSTYKQKFNIKYKQPKNKSNSLRDISKLTGYKLSGLQTIKKSVKSPEQWGSARVYSAVMGGKAQAIDKKHLKKK